MSSRRKNKENSLRLSIGLVLIAVALNVFCCNWSSKFQESSPTAIVGVQDLFGVYAKHDRAQDMMLGMIVPAALICVGAYVGRED